MAALLLYDCILAIYSLKRKGWKRSVSALATVSANGSLPPLPRGSIHNTISAIFNFQSYNIFSAGFIHSFISRKTRSLTFDFPAIERYSYIKLPPKQFPVLNPREAFPHPQCIFTRKKGGNHVPHFYSRR